MQKFFVLALCIAVASAGAVVPTYMKALSTPKVVKPFDVEGTKSCGN